MMARILVIQHSPYEPLGIIIHTLKRMKLRIRYVNFARDPHQRVNMSRYHGIVVLGGAMHPNELDLYPHLIHEIELLQVALAKEVPILGICLGSQLLNIALGGFCYALDKPEFGWIQVDKCGEHELFELFDKPIHVFQWHQFANQITSGVDVVLKNTQCVQAFSYRNSIGLQFHLEVDAHLMRRWLEHPDYLEHLRRHLQPEDIQGIHLNSKNYLPRSMVLAKQFFTDFCRLFNKKSYALSSHTAGRDLF
ncbi:type 1 glutamine amidotransferase [Legionella longbeachae]|uniref:Putative glutamine amidotransferase n=1 Tax=Legionella longbeachae serogroup 1 (strain NSW150) TaxID=661367 RepID=D3HS76_LEGLN|nr:type 1 glutamine amidotransferase [Legionella longbeachae]VEE02260.1 glutamine amidotransferase [Legionella oakridgensis]HBD7399333.1 gamma-glutamyl-gamma-aminobutyrate hydrolase family protein [Legionella pneumophila]ARB91444.1 glutamine amidotransferase [Legionella longbeachae]EEZ95105.1 glutamine amidotransferase class-I domain protein [Legionella longbeachae D-4968]QIN32130.1 glutamine amidotransferase [Legionella longbeachae]